MEEIISSRRSTRKILKKYGLKLYKGMGQNFLVEPDILSDIVSAAGIKKDDDISGGGDFI